MKNNTKRNQCIIHLVISLIFVSFTFAVFKNNNLVTALIKSIIPILAGVAGNIFVWKVFRSSHQASIPSSPNIEIEKTTPKPKTQHFCFLSKLSISKQAQELVQGAIEDGYIVEDGKIYLYPKRGGIDSIFETWTGKTSEPIVFVNSGLPSDLWKLVIYSDVKDISAIIEPCDVIQMFCVGSEPETSNVLYQITVPDFMLIISKDRTIKILLYKHSS